MVHGDGRSTEKTLADMILEEYPEMRDVGEPTVYVDQKTKRKSHYLVLVLCTDLIVRHQG